MRTNRFLAVGFVAVAASLLTTSDGSNVRAAVLYGVTGDGASTSESLFTIDQTDATSTFVTAFGAGNDGETIAYNPTNGLMYHWSGLGDFGVDEFMDNLNLDTLSANNIPLSGANYEELFAATYNPTTGEFVGVDIDSNFVSISTTGVVSNLGNTSVDDIKGLAFVGNTLFAIEQFDGFDSDGELDLLTLDSLTGSVLTSINVSLAGVTLNGNSNGLATNPDTGELWAIIQGGGGRRLVTIDSNSGVASEIGVLSDSFAGIAFAGDSVATVPEPASGLMLLSGVALIGLVRRRNKREQAV